MLLQASTAAAANTASHNLWDLIVDGGFLMIPLALLLLLSIYIFTERCIVIARAVKIDPTLMKRVRENVTEGDIESAKRYCKRQDTVYSRLIDKGLSRLGRSSQEVMATLDNSGNLEISHLGKGLAWLSTTAGAAPMIGFLGTVVGMMEAFWAMADSGSAVSIASLGSGISLALVTTVAGLVVGILALFAYNYLTSRLNKVMTNMEAQAMDFMDLLNEPSA